MKNKPIGKNVNTRTLSERTSGFSGSSSLGFVIPIASIGVSPRISSELTLIQNYCSLSAVKARVRSSNYNKQKAPYVPSEIEFKRVFLRGAGR